jgi:hypothetical protein
MKPRERPSLGLLQDDGADDPLSSLANLFDVSMVFAVALMVAMVSFMKMSEMLTQDDVTIVKNPGQENMEIIRKDGETIERYRASDRSPDGENLGRRIGTAYQLESGEIIYIPESRP